MLSLLKRTLSKSKYFGNKSQVALFYLRPDDVCTIRRKHNSIDDEFTNIYIHTHVDRYTDVYMCLYVQVYTGISHDLTTNNYIELKNYLILIKIRDCFFIF